MVAVSSGLVQMKFEWEGRGDRTVEVELWDTMDTGKRRLADLQSELTGAGLEWGRSTTSKQKRDEFLPPRYITHWVVELRSWEQAALVFAHLLRLVGAEGDDKGAWSWVTVETAWEGAAP